MKNVIILYLSTLFILSACKKEEIELIQEPNVAPFFLNGTYNGSSVDFEIGKNDYFMRTDFNKLIRPGTNGKTLYTLKSFLSPKDSIGYPNSLQLIMYANTKDSLLSSFNIDSVFYPGLSIPVNDNLGDSINEMVVLFGDNIDPNPIYLSSVITQASSFTVTKVLPYRINDLGQKTVKISFTLDCFVGRIGIASKRLNIKGVFAFSYPS